MPERSRPESFLPARSAGWRAVAEAMAASTSARVISADAISGDARSTCCIMPWDAAGMAHARPNIPIAAIRFDARIIVSLTSAAAVPGRPLPRRQTAERIIALGYRRDHLHDRLLAASREARTGGRQVRGFCALCGGLAAPRVHTPPWPWLESCRNRAGCDDICGGSCEPQKASASGRRVGRDGHFTNTQYCERAIRRPMLEAAITYFIATMACAKMMG